MACMQGSGQQSGVWAGGGEPRRVRGASTYRYIGRANKLEAPLLGHRGTTGDGVGEDGAGRGEGGQAPVTDRCGENRGRAAAAAEQRREEKRREETRPGDLIESRHNHIGGLAKKKDEQAGKVAKMGPLATAIIACLGLLAGWAAIEVACKPCLDSGRAALDRSLNPDYDVDDELPAGGSQIQGGDYSEAPGKKDEEEDEEAEVKKPLTGGASKSEPKEV